MINFTEKLSKIHIPFLSSLHVYFDLGTSLTRIAIKDKGVVLREPSYIGYNSRSREYLFFGTEAKTILGKTPDFIKISRPMVNGILSDFDAEVALMHHFLQRGIYPYFSSYKFIKPQLTGFTCIPALATEIEQKAVQEVLMKTGCSRVYSVEKSLATAAGCGFDVFSHQPHFIVDAGAGLIELAIISGGGIVVQKTIKNAGDHMNKLIANYTHLKHGVLLGEATCEELKTTLLNFTDEEDALTVRGKSLETGLPKSIRMKSSDVKEALINNFTQILDGVKELIEISPPEIANEVFKYGITVTGNMAGIKGLDHYIATELKIETYVPTHYADAAIYGLIALGKSPQNFIKLGNGR
ncbi:rod shape-determining protein [Candidatus Roizmanbacteria bacterium]|nr:rod shape-determining protein [Candidatus Roizmanbacteria bacterium]